MTLRVAIVNPVWHAALQTPDALLEAYPTLTGWAEAVAGAGADVTVHQRFPHPGFREHRGVRYTFVADRGPARPGRWWRQTDAMMASLAAARPDVLHLNGVVFPEYLRQVRRHLPSACVLVVQDHGGFHPHRAGVLSRRWVRRGLAVADVLMVSSRGHAELWRASGAAPRTITIASVMESSTTLVPLADDVAAARSGMRGDPALLWVGRLTPNKDPLTALDGIAAWFADFPAARLTMVWSAGEWEAAVRRLVAASATLNGRVDLVGAVPRAGMAAFYSAADIFVAGSRAEGSGYAALEAMACGAVPVLTDIPSFAAMTAAGTVGALWTPGDPGSLTAALHRVMHEPFALHRERVRRHFETTLSWPVVGRRAVEVYSRARAV